MCPVLEGIGHKPRKYKGDPVIRGLGWRQKNRLIEMLVGKSQNRVLRRHALPHPSVSRQAALLKCAQAQSEVPRHPAFGPPFPALAAGGHCSVLDLPERCLTAFVGSWHSINVRYMKNI